jgi:MFS family permease
MRKKRDVLFVVLFLIIFINGFESGGYQASLLEIGKEYNLTHTSMGFFASFELLADMLAPILLGHWADRTGKRLSILVMLGIQVVSNLLIVFWTSNYVFLFSIFMIGLTTSALQFISLAALADAYPVTGTTKIGYITSLYALGALVSPLIVRFYLRMGIGWRMLFILLAATSLIALLCVRVVTFLVREQPVVASQEAGGREKMLIVGVLLLCVIMCIYVGFENGFSFFIDTYMNTQLHTENGKIVLSVFWAAMIPARILAGKFSAKARQILYLCCISIPILTIAIAFSTSQLLIFILTIPLGMASGAIYPSVLNTSFGFAGKSTATVTGMITTATGVGGVIFTALTGILTDQFGIRMAIAALAAFFILAILSVAGLGRVGRMKVKKQSE